MKRVNIYLHYFQQEEYDNFRFLSWIFKHTYFDKKVSLALIFQSLLIFTLYSLTISSILLITISFVSMFIAFLLVNSEPNPLKSSYVKKKLVITERVKKIKILSFYLWLIFAILGMLASIIYINDFKFVLLYSFLVAFLTIQLIPYFIIISNWILSFNENKIQRFYLSDAKRIYKLYAPYTIGITGSYGKTSTKMLLTEILNQTLAPTFSPIASINTLMGVTAFIRKNLRLFHKYSIIEMGAYNVGSIKRLCNLTPPDAAIVTSVGIMHLERYGSQEQVFRAKSELPKEISKDGILVCNGDDPYCRRMATEYKTSKTYLYGFENKEKDLDVWISNLSFDKEGSHFTINYKEIEYEISCKIFGKPLISNVLACFTMACALGASPEHVAVIIQTLETYDNRLQLVNTNWGDKELVVLKDAYNSNPVGFKAALEVLGNIEGNQKILVTPGMVELGNEQYTKNKEIAIQAAGVCDYVYIVGSTNKKAFLDGLKEKEYKKEKIVEVKEMKEALDLVKASSRNGDVVLIENDLPDIYEKLITI